MKDNEVTCICPPSWILINQNKNSPPRELPFLVISYHANDLEALLMVMNVMQWHAFTARWKTVLRPYSLKPQSLHLSYYIENVSILHFKISILTKKLNCTNEFSWPMRQLWDIYLNKTCFSKQDLIFPLWTTI